MVTGKKSLRCNLIEKIIKIIDNISLKFETKWLILLKKILLAFKAKIIFHVEEAEWAIKWVGKYVTESLKKQKLIDAELTHNFLFKNKILHYGSINCLHGKKNMIRLYNSNKHVLTWFHLVPNDPRLKFIPYINENIDIIHTSNPYAKEKLIKAGIDEHKIVVIPLGVDLSFFKPFGNVKRQILIKKFDLPENKIIIGSFQKDGVGWGEGLEPKLIKGPDIFCEVVKNLYKEFKIHIFLTGPARGYVKKQLEENDIPYTHIFVKNHIEMVNCYNVLDLYLVTSRAEGGPLALLEGMATGVPLVTTNVGMAPILIQHGLNGFIADIDDINQLFQHSTEIIKNKELREKIIVNGLKTVKNYGWKLIANEYYEKIYKRLLN